MSDTILANDGNALPVGNLSNSFTYDVNNNVTTITVHYTNFYGILKTYVQTFTWSGVNLLNISQWTVQ